MFKRDLSSYNPDQQGVHKKVIEEARELFGKKAEKLTVFHSILIDRIAIAYLVTLKLDTESTVSDKKFKNAQDNLQSWLRMTFTELHSSEKELKRRQEFYQECVAVLEDLVADENLRRDIFVRLKEVVEERDKNV